jgi:hypothetical protein
MLDTRFLIVRVDEGGDDPCWLPWFAGALLALLVTVGIGNRVAVGVRVP